MASEMEGALRLTQAMAIISMGKHLFRSHSLVMIGKTESGISMSAHPDNEAGRDDFPVLLQAMEKMLMIYYDVNLPNLSSYDISMQ